MVIIMMAIRDKNNGNNNKVAITITTITTTKWSRMNDFWSTNNIINISYFLALGRLHKEE